MRDESWKDEIRRITEKSTANINEITEKYSAEILVEIARLKEKLEKKES